ncbi:S24 family peptidase [Pseudomonas aeruginosa]|nr:S24 family peptidase [Pseudomonas aeruginosa]MBK1490970.1 S24 family peptidase [Pseudomonas aeruginosa]MBX6349627.1 S24 family peptidase [Pseudomonas aeruginosa]MCW5464387.1 S24 family peptidase [Pseudomonas aeruginosa]TRM23405.1 S24 family peptidase [Pseudomonas aeruginosa]
MEMLQRHGKGLSGEAKEKIAQAVAESLDGDQSTTSNVIHADFSRTTLVKGNSISIAQYDVRAAMGGGQVPAEYREFVRNLVVDRVQLDDLGLKYTDPANLKIITGWGQSMLGTIEDKSPILVDVGITDFVEEGVYVFTWLQHLFVKRVQIHDAEHYLLVSDNKSFEPQKARMEDVRFQAKVLGAWNFRKL